MIDVKNRMARFLIGVSLLLVGFVRAESGFTIGPFSPKPVVTCYILVDKAPVEVRVSVRGGDRVMLRTFDPDEQLSFWRYAESELAREPSRLGDYEIWGMPTNGLDISSSDELLLNSRVTLSSVGIHQIRIVTGSTDSEATLSFSEPVDYGVSFQNGTFSGWGGQPGVVYAYVPPHAEELVLAGGPGSVSDQNGQVLARLRTSDLKKTVRIPVEDAETVWTFELPPPRVSWAMRAAGFPLILCSSEQAARTIRASVEVLPDGTVVCHKFQRRIAEFLPKLLAEKNVGETECLTQSAVTNRLVWQAEPARNIALLKGSGLYPAVEWALKNQNVETNGHWSGAMGGWQDRINKPFPESRWDRLKSVKGLWAGASIRSGGAEGLAQAALLKIPTNPYFGKKELLFRAAAASLRDLMALGEDETWRGVGSDLTDYSGLMAFTTTQKTFPPYRLAAPYMPEDVREVWTEGLRHVVDRLFTESLVTARNQSSHFLVAFQDFAEGSSKPRYAEMARTFAQRFADGQHPAGFHMELCGPDASYIGMTHWHMAVYYQQSKDPVILESLRKSYRFFNHTVAPEPDGQMLGGCNFNHRVGNGFYNEQWLGAKGILDAVLPEVGIWASVPREVTAEDELDTLLESPPPYSMINLNTPRCLYWGEPNSAQPWPVFEKERFIHEFAGELVAVRRPAYYAVIYVGKPVPDPYYISKREGFRLLTDVENSGGTAHERKVTPFLGGGLSQFWTPQYGSSVLAANWSPLTHHGLVATRDDGKRYWEDYFETTYELNRDSGELICSGQVENTPLTYTRCYRFNEDKIIVDLELRADADITLAAFHENIPFAAGDVKSRGAELIMNGHLQVVDETGAGVTVSFENSREVMLQPDGLQRNGLQFTRAEVPLPSVWTAGETHNLTYTLEPIRKK